MKNLGLLTTLSILLLGPVTMLAGPLALDTAEPSQEKPGPITGTPGAASQEKPGSTTGTAGAKGSQSTPNYNDRYESKQRAQQSAQQQQRQRAEKGGSKPWNEATLTGCISAKPNASSNYTLSNGTYKKGIEIGPTDKVKDHAGHQTQLTGQWSADKKTFKVASLKHISETCEMAPGGGTAGTTKKGKETSAPPK